VQLQAKQLGIKEFAKFYKSPIFSANKFRFDEKNKIIVQAAR